MAEPWPAAGSPGAPFETRRTRRQREATLRPVPVPPPRDTGRQSLLRRLLRLAALPGLAAILLAWSLTTLIGDVAWGRFGVVPVVLAGLSPLLAVPVLMVLSLALRRRNWTALVPALAAGLLPWSFMVGYVLPAPPPAGPSVPLRALLVTARHGSADAAEITAAARAHRADVVVVTELNSTLAHNLTKAGLARSLPPRYVWVPDGGAPPTAGLAVFSRFDLAEIQQFPGTTWPAIRARVMIGDGPVTLVAGHAVRPSVDLDAWRRDLRAFGTAGQIRGPVVVLANLSATPWNAQFRRIVSGRLHDAGDVLGRGLRPTWPSWSPVPLLPLDHALVAGAGVSSSGTVAIGGTDHRALTVELRVPSRADG